MHRARLLPGLVVAACAVIVFSASRVSGGGIAFALGVSEAQGEGQLAGIVNAAIPDESVQRWGQGKEIQLQLSDAINVNDVVRTLQAGRVRIALLDGSLLSLGARSVMRITKHDPQGQQTEIELHGGRLRANMVKLTQGGASFEVKTPTAVIGVVGTDFVVLAEAESLTTVYAIEGVVVVRNRDFNVEGLVMVRPGERTTVRPGQPPTTPERVAPAELQSETDQTNVGLTGTTQAGGPLPPPVVPTAAKTPTEAAVTPSEPEKTPPQDLTKTAATKRRNRTMLLTTVAIGAGLAAAIVAVAASGSK